MKIIIIAAAAVLILIGGGYYYWEIYRVPDAALDLVMIFQKDFGGAMQRAQAAQPKDTDDYVVILSAIEATKGDFKNVEGKLASMWPPSKLKEVRNAMLEMVQALRAVLAKAEMKARFMSDLSGLMRGLFPKETDKKLGPNATVGDLANLWTSAIPETKSKGDALFGEEAVELNETTFEELKSKWNEARDNFDTAFVLVRAQNQKMPMRDFYPDRMQMTERERAAFTKVGTFIDLVEKTISQNSAYDIVRGEDSAGKSSQENLQAKSEALNAAFKRFSDENPDIVKKIEAEAQKRGLKP